MHELHDHCVLAIYSDNTIFNTILTPVHLAIHLTSYVASSMTETCMYPQHAHIATYVASISVLAFNSCEAVCSLVNIIHNYVVRSYHLSCKDSIMQFYKQDYAPFSIVLCFFPHSEITIFIGHRFTYTVANLTFIIDTVVGCCH